MAPPVIRKVKEKANSHGTVILDIPPGTSCPVVQAVKGSDFCLLVTEPTPFGLNDLSLAVEMVRELNIPFGVVLNRPASERGAGMCQKKTSPSCLPSRWPPRLPGFIRAGLWLRAAEWEWLQAFQAVKGLNDEKSWC
jgi:hypothetical protein